MNEYLKKFDTLNSSQLEVFLWIFLGIFYFFKFKFEVLNLGGLKPAGTGTGHTRYRGFRTGGEKNPERIR